MPKRIYLLLIVIVLLVLSGCAQKTKVVLIPDSHGNVGQLIVTNDKGTTELSKAQEAIVVSDRKSAPTAPKILSDAEITADFSEALAIEPAQPKHFLLYFESESTELTAESTTRLPNIMATITNEKSHDISVIGHTDTAGDYQYNLSLSRKRATAVSNLLIQRGVPASIIQTTSHGEKNPLVKTADNVSEPKNRRVEVVVR